MDAGGKKISLKRCGAAPFAVFDLPPVFEHVRESRFNEIPSNLNVPFSISQADTLLRFSIPASLNKWLSSEFILHTKVKLLHSDGTVVTAAEQAGLIANGLNGIWNKAVVSINNHEVYTCSNYSHVSYLTSALMLPKAEHDRMNRTELYYPDVSPVDDIQSNTGWNQRVQSYVNGAEIEMIGALRIPLFGTARCIPHGVRVDISLYSHAPTYFVHANTVPAGTTYKLEVTYCHLHYQSMDMTDGFLKEYQLLFDRGERAYLPFLDYKAFTMRIKRGAVKDSSSQYTVNGYPRRVFVAFASETKFKGTYASTPYEFPLAAVETVKLKVGESELQLRTNPNKAHHAELYFHMFRALGWTGSDGYVHGRLYQRDHQRLDLRLHADDERCVLGLLSARSAHFGVELGGGIPDGDGFRLHGAHLGRGGSGAGDRARQGTNDILASHRRIALNTCICTFDVQLDVELLVDDMIDAVEIH